MATDDSTSSDKAAAESQLEKQYPISADPFAVWYCKGEGAKWLANDEKGRAIAMAANHKDALKIANAFRAGAYEKAVKKADALRGGASVLMPHHPHEIRMSATTLNTEERRAGAMACMDALRIIDRIAASGNEKSTWEECWRAEDASITAMQHAAGNHGEFMAAFVAVFAEYAHMNISGGEPDLYKWRPAANMTDEEIKEARARAEKFANDYEDLKGNTDAKPEEVNHA